MLWYYKRKSKQQEDVLTYVAMEMRKERTQEPYEKFHENKDEEKWEIWEEKKREM